MISSNDEDPEILKKFTWEIPEFESVLGNEELMKSNCMEFELSETLPVSKWRFGLKPSNGWPNPPENRVILNLESLSNIGHREIFRKCTVSVVDEHGTKFIKFDSFVLERGNDWNSSYLGFYPHQKDTHVPLVRGTLILDIVLVINREVLNTGMQISNARDNRNMLYDAKSADVKILSNDGNQFLAHRNILAASNEVFASMFRLEMSESTTGIIKLEDMKSKQVELLLHVVYCNEILPFCINPKKLPEDEDLEIEGVLYVVFKYQLNDALRFIESKLEKVCGFNNAHYLLGLVNKYPVGKKFKNYVWRYIYHRTALLRVLFERFQFDSSIKASSRCIYNNIRFFTNEGSNCPK